jgi:hypothetical protein
VTVKELLGHADIKTTMGYSHATPESKKSAVNLLPVSDKSDRLVIDRDFTQKVRRAKSLKNNGGGTRIRTGDNGFARRDDQDD